VGARKDQDDCTALERWMRIDHIYCRTAQLFEEAAVDSSSSSILERPIAEVGAGDVIWGTPYTVWSWTVYQLAKPR
jgi:hypothetical protein